MRQQERLNQFNDLDLIWATNKYLQILQTVLQNKMLVEHGFWDTLLCDSDELTAKLYHATRAKMIAKGRLDEMLLHEMVVAAIAKS